MITKIIKIKNVGRFKNWATQNIPQLAKHTLIYGANGFGKTTICAILRSLQTGDSAYVIGRKTLGESDPQLVELLFSDSLVRFQGLNWNQKLPALAIFDSSFIADNVHSGEVVDIQHKRSLYRVIVGHDGVHLAEEDTRLARESVDKTREITALTKTIQTHIPPGGMTLEKFLNLPPDPAIEEKILSQEGTIEAIRKNVQIQNRDVLSEFTLPRLPEGLTSLLKRTIDDIAEDAEQQLSDHLTAHGMKGEAWPAEGVSYAEHNTCPFCGQDIEGLALIGAYRAVFGDAYKALKVEVTSLQEQIQTTFGEGGLSKLTLVAEQNRGSADFWGGHCTFDASLLNAPSGITDAVRNLGHAALALLQRKAASPLDIIVPDDIFTEALSVYESIQSGVAATNLSIQAVNAIINRTKAATDEADIKIAEADLSKFKAIRKRHEVTVANLCADYGLLLEAKKSLDEQKKENREKLEAYSERVVQPYEERINYYLDAFNAGFQIAKTKHDFRGGSAASNYQLVIEGTSVDLGDGNTPADQPSFKNTLSAGDRSTLALAFFLAHLEKDPGRAEKIVVFDDPFTSQDAFRRCRTVHEIKKVGQQCAQIIVLSHDASFLKQVWDKALPAERIALQIFDARLQGSKIHSMNLDEACRGRAATEVDDLLGYITTGHGSPLDMIKKMRVVLETFLRTTYPGYFEADDWLGEMVRKIREAGDDHPAQSIYDELDQTNDYDQRYHHGEDRTDMIPDTIDTVELTGFIRRTLRTVNAMPA